MEILLPRPMLETFLAEADLLERRMAEDSMISIEVVRLTDRDIISGAVASRLDSSFRGVHDIERFNQDAVVRQAGINALTAIANRELQIVNLEGIEAGTLPAGTPPVTLPAIELPPIQRDRTATTLGTSMAIGADEAFFDGTEQSYGFSYIGPDGIEHRLAFDVVDNLREFWDRIERNLIVHKIRKTETLEQFTVPVGPATKTFEGIAALISQENQQIVVATGTGAISELSATAGTWLVIKDFEITPIPGSSTALSETEIQAIEDRVLLTMLLRDPLVSIEVKTGLVEADHREELRSLLDELRGEYRDRPLRDGNRALTFGDLYDARRKETLQDASLEKKERNSKITLTFYSSQGTILDKTGVTALGDANDLTSFTTQLSPNVVTPISSFFTKSASGTKDTSQITGVARGENENKEKTMTHLVVRARFPTDDRERKDRDEGRFLGYFELPLSREPLSTVNLPFLSSSEHPLERLAQVRVGRMFPALDASRIKKASVWFNPNSLAGDVPREVWEACQTRLLMNIKILSESAPHNQALTADYRQRFIIEVRSLLEYDPDFFDAPNIALRNMSHWNDPNRIVLALRNGAGRFALQRLIAMIDELGLLLVPQDYVDNYLAVASTGFWGRHRIALLSEAEVTALRRDVANHFLRIEEVYGDAFLEAVSLLCGLGTYHSTELERVSTGPFDGYADLVVFDNSTELHADPALTRRAHEDFLLLRSGGFEGGLFEPSFVTLSDLTDAARTYVVRGAEILDHAFSALSSYRHD